MDALVALAISIGVLIAVWTYLALGVAALPVWAGIVAWGAFFAAGGKTTGLVKTIAANLSGVSGPSSLSRLPIDSAVACRSWR